MNTWWEPFAGTGAVGLRAIGLKPLTNYMGTKSRYASKILEYAPEKPNRLWLTDSGPWGTFWCIYQWLGTPLLGHVADQIEEWCAEDQTDLYLRLAKSPASSDLIALYRVKGGLYGEVSGVHSGLE
jgi:hypothetical protein